MKESSIESFRLVFDDAPAAIEMLRASKQYLYGKARRDGAETKPTEVIYFGRYGVEVDRIFDAGKTKVVLGVVAMSGASAEAWRGAGVEEGGVLPRVIVEFPPDFLSTYEASVHPA